MKKLLIAVLAVILISMPVQADENEIDLSDITLSAYETNDLVSLMDRLNAEIISRTGEGWDRIGDGVFFVGEHIKPGMYEFMNTSDLWSIVRIYDSKDAYNEDQENGTSAKAFLNSDVFENDVCNINLTDGQILVINGSGLFRENKPSWAP